MKVGIFGDVHANVAALEAVLAALDREACDQLVCTGDVVGYGPSPSACIKLVRDRQIPCVLGNHDQYAADILGGPKERIEADTWATIEWTRQNLELTDLEWLAALPLRLEFPDFLVVHGSLGANHWAYLVNRTNLAEHFSRQAVRLVFCGHTHLPLYGIQKDGVAPSMDFLRKGPLPATGRFVINPGSVGQPRDRDPRAACCTYDTVTQLVTPLRVPYDIGVTQDLMRAAKIADRFIKRLEIGH